MFETKRGRGVFLVVLAVVLSAVVAAASFFAERSVDEEARTAARLLVSELGRYESLVDVQAAMASGEVDLPAGASIGTDERGVVAWQEVRALMAVRCARVIATASAESVPLTVGQPSVEERPCGR